MNFNVAELLTLPYPTDLNQPNSPPMNQSLINNNEVINQVSTHILSPNKNETNELSEEIDFLVRVEMYRQKTQLEIPKNKDSIFLGSNFRYFGGMIDGQFEGKGTIYWENGDVVTGEFHQGKLVQSDKAT